MGLYQFDVEDAKRFAAEQGIKVRVRGSELMFKQCPYCRNLTDDKNKFAINIHTGAFNCLRASCGAKGNMITLARDFGFSLGRDVDEYYNRARRFRNIRKFPLPIVKPEAVRYLEGRGISQDITEKYKVTVRKDDEKVLVFCFYDEHAQLQFIKYRKTDFDPEKDNNKEWCMSECKPILFGMDQCDPTVNHGTLVMTEGQIDSLSVAEAYDGYVNVVSVPNGKNGFTWVPYCWDFLRKFRTLVVFGDYERDEITLLDEMRSRFPGTVKHVRPEDYKDCKDANDILRKYGKAAVRAAVENAVITENPRIKPLAEVKRKDLDKLEKIETGIPQIDQMIGGMYMGQLVLLTGERGLGKSTVGSQFCVRGLEQGFSVFAYSGELNDWMFQSWLDRQCAGPGNINVKVHANGFKDFIVDDAILDTIHTWYHDRFYLYDNQAIVDGDEAQSLLKIIEDAITQYSCRVIFIDNLMTAMDDDLSADLYRQQATFCRKLAEMARRMNVLIILVAHPRKGNRQEFVNDDIAGSGNITNLADLVIRYTRPKELGDNADRIIQVTKNRLTGRIHFGSDGAGVYFEEKSKRIAPSKYSDEYGFDFRLGWMDAAEDADGFLALPEDMDIPFDVNDEVTDDLPFC